MHGGNWRWAKETYDRELFIDLSANINAFGPPPGVWNALQAALPEIVHYPDPESRLLTMALAAKAKIPPQQILTGNGAGELIYTVMLALKPNRVAIPVPAFSEYGRAAAAVGASIMPIPLGAEGWESLAHAGHDREFWRQWERAVNECDLAVVCSPHNPTGSMLNYADFVRMFEIAVDSKCHILFDESFYDFLPDSRRWSARCLVSEASRLIVLYSLTKFFALPGLRLGAVFAEPRVIDCLRRHRDPWSVNILAEAAGVSALADDEFPAWARQQNAASKEHLFRRFEELRFNKFRLLPSSANFALIEVQDRTSGELATALGRQGLLVRDCADFLGLDGQFIRVAIKDISSMNALLAAFDGLR